MFYVTHKLHMPADEVLTMYVVEVKEGAVVRCFPFEAELQSMVWKDELFLSSVSSAWCLNDIVEKAVHDAQPLCLYEPIDGVAVRRLL